MDYNVESKSRGGNEVDLGWTKWRRGRLGQEVAVRSSGVGGGDNEVIWSRRMSQ